ncbi:aromatic-ring-hydroxylating dioxygenase subunit beta [Novosphingobium terrae]|uniref:aromatic-ring-hydroxylating dioxygenase subunit beta n=1 Tax=Novosphingobium terrae TaxID=2726189 RepID=UPI00198054F7|nr:aromatic-ring-hydroxylating dioxygenase subunit beta [Novosphingobium terrae]
MSTATLTRHAISLDDATRFIWAEADILDRLDYRAWLPLWTKDGRYTIPIEHDAVDYDNQLNVAHDDEEMRQARVKRLLSGFSMSAAPPARTVRTISRFVVTAAADDLIELRSAMVLVEYKYERTRVLAGDVEFRLKRDEGVIKLDRKVVRLANCDDYLHGIGYLL